MIMYKTSALGEVEGNLGSHYRFFAISYKSTITLKEKVLKDIFPSSLPLTTGLMQARAIDRIIVTCWNNDMSPYRVPDTR